MRESATSQGDVRLSLLCCQCRRRFAVDLTHMLCTSSSLTLDRPSAGPHMRTRSAATASPLAAPEALQGQEAEMHQKDRDGAMAELMAGCNGFAAYLARLLAPHAEDELASSSSPPASSSSRLGETECMGNAAVQKVNETYDLLCASRAAAAGRYAALCPSPLSPWQARAPTPASTMTSDATLLLTALAAPLSSECSVTATDTVGGSPVAALPPDAALQTWHARMGRAVQQACQHSQSAMSSDRTSRGTTGLRASLPSCVVQHADWLGEEVAAACSLRDVPIRHGVTCQTLPCSPVTSPRQVTLVAAPAKADEEGRVDKGAAVSTPHTTAFAPCDLCPAAGAGDNECQIVVCAARREAVLHRLMRHLVQCGGGDDVRLPLCLGCWHNRQLAPAQWAAVAREEDMALCAASAAPTLASLACCYVAPRLGRRPHTCVQHAVCSTSGSSSCSEARDGVWHSDAVGEEAEFRAVDLAGATARLPQRELDEVNAQLACVGRKLGEVRAIRGALERQVRENETLVCVAAQRVQSRRVTARYEQLDEAASRACFAATLRRSMCFLSHMPLLALLYPIDVSGPVGLIDGLRLGLEAESSLTSPPYVVATVPTTLRVAAESASDEAVHLAEDTMRQRLSSQRLLSPTAAAGKVQLAEVNTACGTLLRLLVCLAQLHGYRYRCALLHPCGEASTIDILQTRERSSAAAAAAAAGRVLVSRRVDFHITDRFFAWRTFGTACVVVATCLRELCELLTEELQLVTTRGGAIADSACEHDTQMNALPASAPYVIRHDIVGGVSVRHGSVSNAVWTAAMRHLLADAQWATCVSAKLARLRNKET